MNFHFNFRAGLKRGNEVENMSLKQLIYEGNGEFTCAVLYNVQTELFFTGLHLRA